MPQGEKGEQGVMVAGLNEPYGMQGAHMMGLCSP